VRAKRRRSVGTTVKPSGSGGQDCRRGVLGGVSARGWRRTGQGASMGCGGAREALGCGRGAVEAANGGEQKLRRRSGDGSRAEKKNRGEMRARERVKEVDEGSWTCCGTKKRHGRAGVAAGGRRHAWRLRATAARRGGAGKSQQGSGERRAGELEGQVCG
jgi:hypothetical protein